MSEYYGKDTELRVDGSVVICFRSINISINGEAIDITDSCSQGFRDLARDPAVISINFGIDGVAKTRFLRDAAIGSGKRLLENCELILPPIEGGSEGDKISGDFYLADYSEGVTHDNATTFTATLQTAGVYTYTPEIPLTPASSSGSSSSSEGFGIPYFVISGGLQSLHLYDEDLNILPLENHVAVPNVLLVSPNNSDPTLNIHAGDNVRYRYQINGDYIGSVDMLYAMADLKYDRMNEILGAAYTSGSGSEPCGRINNAYLPAPYYSTVVNQEGAIAFHPSGNEFVITLSLIHI